MHAEIIDLVYHHGKSVKEAGKDRGRFRGYGKNAHALCAQEVGAIPERLCADDHPLAGRDRTAKDGRPRAARRLARSTNFRNLR
jgi:hypothetical protein